MANRLVVPQSIRLAIVVVACFTPWLATAAEAVVMTPFSASYTVRYGVLRGDMTLDLERRDTGYSYATSLAPRGLVSLLRRGEIRETTALVAVDDGLLPEDYVSIDTIASPSRRVNYRFDRASGRVTGEYKEKEIDMPMRSGGHNRISAQLAIMRALQTGASLPGFSVFDRGRWKAFEFEIIPDQTANTPAGDFATVEVRYSSPGDDKEWSLHCAPSLDYLPVMIVFRENGKVKSRASLNDYRIEQDDHNAR